MAKVRRLLGQAAVKAAGYSGAEVARFFRVTAPAVNRLSVTAERPGLKKYLNAL